MKWWPGTESNRRRQPFQGCGLYFEGLSAPLAWLAPYSALRRSPERSRFWRSRDVWWPGTESNRRRQPFQGCALPTELPGHIRMGYIRAASVGPVKTLCVRNVIDYNNDVEFSQTGRQSSRPAARVKIREGGGPERQYTERFWAVCLAESEKRGSAEAW